jgi:hypothetical protein
MAVGGLTAWKAYYQVCPIYLTGGIAGSGSGNTVSLIQLLTAASVVPVVGIGPQQPTNLGGALGPQQPQTVVSLDDAFGAFNVLPGGTLLVYTVPKYPLADQTMAANATVREPLTLSLVWETPMRGANAFTIKAQTMIQLKGLLDNHCNAGGMFTVFTPSYFYSNLILTALTDTSRAGNPLPQNAWRWDFERPQVVTLDEGQGVQSQLLQKVTGGIPTTGALTGASPGAIGTVPTQVPGSGQQPALAAPQGAAAGTPASVIDPRQRHSSTLTIVDPTGASTAPQQFNSQNFPMSIGPAPNLRSARGGRHR